VPDRFLDRGLVWWRLAGRLDSLLTGGSGISKQVLQTIDCPDISVSRVKVLKKWQIQNRRGVDGKRMSTHALGTAWQPTSIMRMAVSRVQGCGR
jgi:hypothetical protein